MTRPPGPPAGNSERLEMPDGHLAACVCSRATITRAQNAPAGAPRL